MSGLRNRDDDGRWGGGVWDDGDIDNVSRLDNYIKEPPVAGGTEGRSDGRVARGRRKKGIMIIVSHQANPSERKRPGALGI